MIGSSRRTPTRFLARLGRMPVGLLASLQGYRWARRQLAAVKVHLADDGVATRAVAPAGRAPRGYRGVRLALRRVEPTCLERALVLQAWFSVPGPAPDVVVGVRSGEEAMEAHAWVDGPDPWFDPTYAEITRLRFDRPD